MIAGTGLRLVLTVLFAAVALHGVHGILRPVSPSGTGRTDTVNGLLHAAMAVAMAVMVWPAGTDVPALPQTVLFSAAALWFAARAALRQQNRAADAAHAVMAAGMAWMVTVMGHAMTPGAPHSPAAHDGHHAAASGVPAMSLTDSGARGVALALAVWCVLAAWWWLARAFDTARLASGPHDALHSACHGAMSAGTAVMLLAMV